MNKINQLFIALFTIAFFISCGSGNDNEAKKTQLEKLKAQQVELADKIKTLQDELSSKGVDLNANEKVKNVAVTAVQPQSFEHSIDVQGRIDGDEIITLSSKAAGNISKLLVHAGDIVKPGQVIAEIENEIVKSQIADLRNSWELANEMFTKQKSLWEQKIGTEMQFLQAKNNKESLEKKMATAKDQLDMFMIKAPFNGTVDEVFIKSGQTVMPGTPCIRVVNMANLKIKADISETYASLINTGNVSKIFFPDINKSIEAKVSYSAKVISPVTRTFGIEIQLPSDENYKPNMVSQVRVIDYNKSDAFVAPINTIQNSDNKSFVFIASKNGTRNVAKKVEVKVGKSYNGNAEILAGLNKGDLLITTGFQDMNDNELIKF